MRIVTKTLLLVLGLVLLLAPAMAATCGAGAADVFYSLNDTEVSGSTTIDVCGNHNATNTGVTTGITGVFGEAYSFDGVNDHIASSNTIVGLGNKTMTFWFQSDVNSFAQTFACNHASCSGGGMGGWRMIKDTSDNIDITVGNGADAGHYGEAFGGPFSTAGQWNFIAAVLNGTALCLYQNSTITIDCDTTLSGTEVAGGSVMYFGEDEDGDRDLTGLMDSITFFPRALTREEIQNMYDCDNIVCVTPPTSNFTVGAFTFTTPVNETSVQDYNISIEVDSSVIGDVNASFHWNNIYSDPVSEGTSGNLTWFFFNQTLPLMAVNNTEFYTGFNFSIGHNDTAQIETDNSTNSSQFVYWAHFVDLFNADPNDPLEGEDIDFTSTLVNYTALPTYSVEHHFNGTNSSTTVSFPLYSNTRTAPDLNQSSLNFSIYSILNVTYGSLSFLRTTTPFNVTVYEFGLIACGGGDVVALNYSNFNETDVLDAVNFSLDSTFWVLNLDRSINTTASFNNTGANSYVFCLSPPHATVLVDSWQQYSSAGTDPRGYFLDNATVDNTTSYINTYVQISTETKLIEVTLKDGSGNPVDDAIIYFQRYYIEENLYRAVAMCLTGEDGTCTTYLEPNDVWFRFQVIQDHLVTYSFSSQTITCDPAATSCILSLIMLDAGAFGEYYDYWDNIAFHCEFIDATNTTSCTVTDTSGLMQYAKLTVEQVGLFTPIEVCSTQSSSSSSTLLCTLSNPDGQYVYTLVAHFAEEVILEGGTIEFGGTAPYGINGLFVTLLITITLGLIGTYSAPISVILAFIGLLASWTLNLLDIGLGALLGMGVVALIIAWGARK